MNPFVEDSALDEAIASAFADLKSHSADEEGYQKAVDQLSKLYKLKHEQAKINLEFHQTEAKQSLEQEKHDLDRDKHALAREEHELNQHKHDLEQQRMDHQYDLDQRPFYKRVNPDTALIVAGNVLVGLAVIKYEQTGVISSKVMSFMRKI